MNGWTVTHQFSGLADVQTDLLCQPQSKGMTAPVWSQFRLAVGDLQPLKLGRSQADV